MTPKSFVQSEIDMLLEKCNFTEQERTLFLMRTQDKSLLEISFKLGLAYDTTKQLSRKVNKKILKVI